MKAHGKWLSLSCILELKYLLPRSSDCKILVHGSCGFAHEYIHPCQHPGHSETSSCPGARTTATRSRWGGGAGRGQVSQGPGSVAVAKKGQGVPGTKPFFNKLQSQASSHNGVPRGVPGGPFPRTTHSSTNKGRGLRAAPGCWPRAGLARPAGGAKPKAELRAAG